MLFFELKKLKRSKNVDTHGLTTQTFFAHAVWGQLFWNSPFLLTTLPRQGFVFKYLLSGQRSPMYAFSPKTMSVFFRIRVGGTRIRITKYTRLTEWHTKGKCSLVSVWSKITARQWRFLEFFQQVSLVATWACFLDAVYWRCASSSTSCGKLLCTG